MTDDRNEVPEADPEVRADEQVDLDLEQGLEPEQESKTQYVEFVGSEPFGTEFTSEHTVTRKQLRDAWDVSTPKDLRWTKAQSGPRKGRMLVPASDMSPEALEGFTNDPMFRVVEL